MTAVPGMNVALMWGVLQQVEDERKRQELLKFAGKFKLSCADAEMSDTEFVAVLGEEFGEVSHEANELIGRPERRTLEWLQKMHAECIQVAAVAVARAELYQREIDALVEERRCDGNCERGMCPILDREAPSAGVPDTMPAARAGADGDGFPPDVQAAIWGSGG